MTTLIYLHGFLSSPHSHKAQQVKRWVARQCPELSYHCPQLTPYPARTSRELDALIKSLLPEPVWLIGSSLGGFWASWLAERYHLPAVLVNPAVRPWEFMPDYVGVDLVSYHTDDSYRLEAAHVEEMLACDYRPIKRPHQYWLMVQTGDQTLDYRQALAEYQGCRQLVIPGGDHSFIGLEQQLAEIIQFFRGVTPYNTNDPHR